MILAAKLNSTKFDITLYEKNKALGRKFLVAGKGGFNLTHSEDLEILVNRYHPAYFLKPAISEFSNKDLQNWLSAVGIKTYTGTSKRIFPLKGIKPVEVLNAILEQLEDNHVQIKTNHHWIGFADDNSLLFKKETGIVNEKPDIVVLALGGASWKVTGSDGTWVSNFINKDIICNIFEPSNCAYKVDWPKSILEKMEGTALKNCKFKSGNSFQLGEAIITDFGIEGSGVYPLSPEIRWQLSNKGEAQLYIDFKPQSTPKEIEQKLNSRKGVSMTTFLEKNLNLGETKTLLLKSFSSKEDFTNTKLLAYHIKHFCVKVTGLAPLDEAISTVGGIALNEVNEHFELKKLPSHFVIGEMLDWDAPTGGYLLQACFSMGNNLAHYLNKK